MTKTVGTTVNAMPHTLSDPSAVPAARTRQARFFKRRGGAFPEPRVFQLVDVLLPDFRRLGVVKAVAMVVDVVTVVYFKFSLPDIHRLQFAALCDPVSTVTDPADEASTPATALNRHSVHEMLPGLGRAQGASPLPTGGNPMASHSVYHAVAATQVRATPALSTLCADPAAMHIHSSCHVCTRRVVAWPYLATVNECGLARHARACWRGVAHASVVSRVAAPVLVAAGADQCVAIDAVDHTLATVAAVKRHRRR